jgi:hypothetical protein
MILSYAAIMQWMALNRWPVITFILFAVIFWSAYKIYDNMV